MDRTILLVTYRRLDVTEIEAEEIFGGDYRAVDAVEALAGGREMEEGIIYHFNEMGSSAMIAPPEMEDYLNERKKAAHELMVVVEQPQIYSHPDVSSVHVYEDSAENGAYPTRLESDDDNPNETRRNLDMINANGTHVRGRSGKGIKVAILDTGIAYHDDLVVKGGVSFCPGIPDFRSDSFGHGTHCAGIVAGRIGGIAKDVDMYSIKVADSAESERANPTRILAGMTWAHRNHMNVVSISLAGPPDLIYIPSFANAVQGLMGINCVVVASTGKQREVGYPANTPGIVAVGGCDQNYMILTNTGVGGYGNHLTVLAPGQNVTTTFHKGNGYINAFSGGSAATPHVAGLVALIQEKYPGITPLQVIGKILASAQSVRVGHSQISVFGGATLIDCDAALSLL